MGNRSARSYISFMGVVARLPLWWMRESPSKPPTPVSVFHDLPIFSFKSITLMVVEDEGEKEEEEFLFTRRCFLLVCSLTQRPQTLHVQLNNSRFTSFVFLFRRPFPSCAVGADAVPQIDWPFSFRFLFILLLSIEPHWRKRCDGKRGSQPFSLRAQPHSPYSQMFQLIEQWTAEFFLNQ